MENTHSLAQLIEPARTETLHIIEKAGKNLPYFLSAALILFICYVAAYLLSKWAQSLSLKRSSNALIASAISKFVFLIIIILGIYFSLLTSGLSNLAVTFLGGTGVIGIGLGFALKGTFENYIAGLMISFKDIFRKGELVKINEFEGMIQSVTSRGTTLMDYDGNSIILPNAQVIASPIKNLTRNPKMRLSFDVGIGYEDDLQRVKDLVRSFFQSHTNIVLNDPEPFVSIRELGSATVNVRIFFWVNTSQVSHAKVRSWAIHSIKNLLMENKVSMPDDAREIVFASPLQVLNQSTSQSSSNKNSTDTESKTTFLKEEINVSSEVKELREQALETEPPEKGESLI